MDFGVGMAAGFGAGMGTGIGIGAASRNADLTANLKHYLEQNEMTIFDRDGQPVDVDDLVKAATYSSCNGQNKRTFGIALLLLGVTILGGVAAVFVSRIL